MPDYLAIFAYGETVRIATRTCLEQFQAEWKYHHPLQSEQLDCASQVGSIRALSYNHGGAPLYEIRGIPGVWHESCLIDPALDTAPSTVELFWVREESTEKAQHFRIVDALGREHLVENDSLGFPADLARFSEFMRRRCAQAFAKRVGIPFDDTTTRSSANP